MSLARLEGLPGELLPEIPARDRGFLHFCEVASGEGVQLVLNRIYLEQLRDSSIDLRLGTTANLNKIRGITSPPIRSDEVRELYDKHVITTFPWLASRSGVSFETIEETLEYLEGAKMVPPWVPPLYRDIWSKVAQMRTVWNYKRGYINFESILEYIWRTTEAVTQERQPMGTANLFPLAHFYAVQWMRSTPEGLKLSL